MANSKHVEEVLDLFRSAKDVGCTKAGTEINIIAIDTYPEETTNIVLLGNGKKITIDDLEFAEPVRGETESKVILGEYIFHLEG